MQYNESWRTDKIKHDKSYILGYHEFNVNLQIVLNTHMRKNPYVNQATPKKSFPNFSIHKNPGIKNFNPQNNPVLW